MTTRLRSMLRLFRRVAFWFCCVMAVVCLVLLISTKWWVMRALSSDSGGPCLMAETDTGNLVICYFPQTKPPLRPGRAYVMEQLSPWGSILNPISVSRYARDNTEFGKDGSVIALPLFALANLFAIWPAIHLYRRWRRARRPGPEE